MTACQEVFLTKSFMNLGCSGLTMSFQARTQDSFQSPQIRPDIPVLDGSLSRCPGTREARYPNVEIHCLSIFLGRCLILLSRVLIVFVCLAQQACFFCLQARYAWGHERALAGSDPIARHLLSQTSALRSGVWFTGRPQLTSSTQFRILANTVNPATIDSCLCQRFAQLFVYPCVRSQALTSTSWAGKGQARSCKELNPQHRRPSWIARIPASSFL
jgi:hypothetical protein